MSLYRVTSGFIRVYRLPRDCAALKHMHGVTREDVRQFPPGSRFVECLAHYSVPNDAGGSWRTFAEFDFIITKGAKGRQAVIEAAERQAVKRDSRLEIAPRVEWHYVVAHELWAKRKKLLADPKYQARLAARRAR